MIDYTHNQALTTAREMEEAAPPPPMNKQQKIAIITLDILMILQIAVAVGFAGSNPDNFTPTFFKVFFMMFLPTVIIGFMVIKKFKTPVD